MLLVQTRYDTDDAQSRIRRQVVRKDLDLATASGLPVPELLVTKDKLARLKRIRTAKKLQRSRWRRMLWKMRRRKLPQVTEEDLEWELNGFESDRSDASSLVDEYRRELDDEANHKRSHSSPPSRWRASLETASDALRTALSSKLGVNLDSLLGTNRQRKAELRMIANTIKPIRTSIAHTRAGSVLDDRPDSVSEASTVDEREQTRKLNDECWRHADLDGGDSVWWQDKILLASRDQLEHALQCRGIAVRDGV